MAEINSVGWESFLINHSDAHILQSFTWGIIKSEFGWKVTHVTTVACGAQLLIKQVLPGIRFAYIAKGPIGSEWHTLWPEIDSVCEHNQCAFLKIEPDIWIPDRDNSDSHAVEIPPNFVQSFHSIQPMRTLVIDITGDESLILARMKQKTRYNINLSIKKDIVVKPYTDMGAFYHLMEITGQRDQFGIHSQAYYQRAFDLFQTNNNCQLLVAEFDRIPVAALIVFKYGFRSWYFYGASSDQHRDRMPNYLLQWEAIRWAKSQGCREYDLWGVPDKDLETLEANFSTKNSGLWGVYRFKRGFGGELKHAAGPWDRVYNPFLYRLYSMWMRFHKSAD